MVTHNLRLIADPPGDPLSLLWVQLLDRGWVGVQLFYVLSGFLITRILLRTRNAENSYSGFLARRALRILPLYYATLLVWLVALPALGWEFPHDKSTDGYLWVFLSNWVQPFHQGGALNHFWSLAVEEQFYLLWPFALRWFRPLPFCLVLAGLSLVTRIALLATGSISEVIYLWTPCRMDALALGSAAAVLVEHSQPRLVALSPAFLRWAPWLTLALGAAVSRGFRQTGTLAQTAGYSLLALGFALWIVSLLTQAEWPGNAWLQWPWLQNLGRYSYGIYVIHFPFRVVSRAALAWLGWTPPPPLGVDVVYVLVTFAVVYALAVVCYHAFEAPFLRLKRHFEPRYTPTKGKLRDLHSRRREMLLLVPPTRAAPVFGAGSTLKVMGPMVTIEYHLSERMAAPTPQTTLKARANEAARDILQEDLGLRAGESVAFFHDEQGIACANCFADVARYLRIKVLTRYVPGVKQAVAPGGSLPREDQAILDQADAVLTCFAESPKSAAYRRQLVDEATVDQRVLGTLSPSLHALAQAARRRESDYARQCDDLTQVLLQGQEAEVVTAVRDGRGDVIEEHRLTVPLGGFARAPIASGGPVYGGTWARLPSPEVAIAPVEDSASGVFVLNGAFPGGAIAGTEHLLLVFSAGRLEMVGGNSPRVGDFWRIVESGKGAAGQALGLSELSIRLWDLAATDESPDGLLGIGLGDSTWLGGALRSPVQELMLSRRATLLVDGRSVIRNGQLASDLSAWRESAETVRRLGAALGADCEIRLTAIPAEADTEGRLLVRRPVGHRRVCAYRPGDAQVGEQLCELYLALAEQRAMITVPGLARTLVPRVCSSLTELRGLLAILRRHRLIEMREPASLEWSGGLS